MYSYNKYKGIDPSIVSITCKKARNLVKAGYFRTDQLEDLEQELILRVLDKLEKYNPKKSPFHKFIKHITENSAIDIIRSSVCQEDVSLYDYIDPEHEKSLLIDTITSATNFDDNSDFIDYTESIRLDIDLRTIVSNLPDDLKELYDLLQIMSISDAAKIIGISRNSIYKKIKKLKKHFINHGFEIYIQKNM